MMNRLNSRKNKAASSSSKKNTTTSDSVHSGHYMTSSLQNDDTVEMPIASPDATHNEVTLSVDQENENMLVASSSQTQLDTSGASGQVKSTSSGGDDDTKLKIDDDDKNVNQVTKHDSSLTTKLAVNERTSDQQTISSTVLKEPNKAESSTQLSAMKSGGLMSSAGGMSVSIVGGGGGVGGVGVSKPTQKTGFTARIEIGGVMKTISIVTEDGSISGGLTLYDKGNKSLKNLIYYIKVAYSNNLTSPKWKNFKGLRLQVTEKIRLNNVIWRGWFEQYGRDKQQRNAAAASATNTSNNSTTSNNTPLVAGGGGKRPQQQLICQFTNVFDDAPLPSQQPAAKMSAVEGKFWKAKLEAITNEYKKWRAISRKQIKSSGNSNNDINKNTSNQLVAAAEAASSQQPTAQSSSTSLSLTTLSNKETNVTSSITTSSSYSSAIRPNVDDTLKINTTPATSIPLTSTITTSSSSSPVTTASFATNSNLSSNLQATPTTSFNSNFDTSFNNQPILNNNTSYISVYEGGGGGGGNQVTFYNNNNEYSGMAASTNNNNFATNNNSGSFGYINNEFAGMTNYNQPSMGGYMSSQSVNQNSSGGVVVHNKQIPYNNRYPSPSPGLFQDIDLYTDTLFSTYQVEDPKGNIFGNNPDLFQPDLMHLHPTFDFLDFIDLDIDLKNLDGTSSTSNNNNNSGGIILEPSPPPPPSAVSFHQPNKTISRNSNKQKQMIKNEQMAKSDSSGAGVASVASQPSSIIGPAWDELSDINTLAAVAAAQSSVNNSTTSGGEMSIEIINKKDSSKFGVLVQESGNMSGARSNITTNTTSGSSLTAVNNSPPGVMSSSNIVQQQQQLKMPASLSQINTSINNRRHSLIANHQPLPLDPSKNSALNSTNASSISSSSGSSTIRDLLNTPLISKSSFNESLVKSKVKTDEQSNILIDAVTELNKLQQHHHQSASSTTSKKSSTIDKPSLNSKMLLSLPVVVVDEKSQSKSKSAGGNKRARKASNPVNQSTSHRSAATANAANITDMTPGSSNEDSYDETSMGSSRKKMNSKSAAGVHSDHNQTSGYYNSSISKAKNSVDKSVDHLYERELSESSMMARENKKARSSLLLLTTATSESSDGVKSQKIESPAISTPINTMSRSNSMNSLNNDSTFLSLGGNAEQKRRCNIQQGFDRLQCLVPSLKDKNAKVSKAVMLQKTSDYIKELQRAREKRVADLSVYKREIEDLSDKITECQSMLPASGVSVTGNLNRSEKFEQRFGQYVRERTLENWKFYMFSLFLRPLFDTFVNGINTSSRETIEQSFYDWQQKHCNLVQLRPIAANVLRYISRSTSILTDPSRMPEESYKAVLTNI